jgi:type VI secretion system protein ImpM
MEDLDTNVALCSIELTWGGKLPSAGDFIWSDRRTPLRTQLDNWLLTGMQQFRSTLKDNWESCFDQAPIWNFIVPKDVLGSGYTVGCISPSCDRIGRRFPFIITYAFSTCVPTWHLSKVMNTIPSLFSRTGVLLLNSIRRQWPRETLVTLIQETLDCWKKSLQSIEQTGLCASHNNSVILHVLAGENKNGENDDVSTIPHDRFSSLPWADIENSLTNDTTVSFWWTNGAGGAPLKAFTYGTFLDGTLMTWLFGSSTT